MHHAGLVSRKFKHVEIFYQRKDRSWQAMEFRVPFTALTAGREHFSKASPSVRGYSFYIKITVKDGGIIGFFILYASGSDYFPINLTGSTFKAYVHGPSLKKSCDKLDRRLDYHKDGHIDGPDSSWGFSDFCKVNTSSYGPDQGLTFCANVCVWQPDVAIL